MPRPNLLKHTLDNIELVPADNNLLALVKSAKGLKLGLDARAKAINIGQ